MKGIRAAGVVATSTLIATMQAGVDAQINNDNQISQLPQRRVIDIQRLDEYPKIKELNPNQRLLTALIRIENPLLFTIEEQQGSRWVAIGNNRTITRSYEGTGTRKFRIAPRSSQSGQVFYHSGPPLHMGMYRRQSYSANSEPGKSKIINIRPQEIKKTSYLGHGQVFNPDGSTLLSSAMCPKLVDNNIIFAWIPYWGGTVNGKRASGSKRNYLVPGIEAEDFKSWCEKNMLQKSGFIAEQLSISEMVAAIVNPKQIIRTSSVAPMPGQSGRSVRYWSAGNNFAAYIYDKNLKSYTRLTQFNAQTREKLVSVFKDRSKSFFLVRNIIGPPSGPFKAEIADFSGLIRDLNNFSGTITASRGGGAWYFNTPGEPRLRIDIKSLFREDRKDYNGLYIENQPRRITTQDFRITTSSRNRAFFKLNGRINLPSLDGEVNNPGMFNPDWDYELSRGSMDVEVPFEISSDNSKISVRPIKNCEEDSCILNQRGWKFTLTWLPTSFVREMERDSTEKFRDKIKEFINSEIAEKSNRLTSETFPIPSPPSFPGLGNPLEVFFGINPRIIPNLRIDPNAQKIFLQYRPNVVFVTPQYISSFLKSVRL